MPTIEIAVADKIAQVQGNPVIVCGNSDYTVQFTFDSEWNGYAAKTARFNFVQNGVRLYYDVLFEGNSCEIPVLNDVYEVEIGVYAGDIHTSTPARVPCVRSATDGAAQHPDPPPDIYEQLLDYLENLGGGGGVVGEASLHAAGALGGFAGVLPVIETLDLMQEGYSWSQGYYNGTGGMHIINNNAGIVCTTLIPIPENAECVILNAETYSERTLRSEIITLPGQSLNPWTRAIGVSSLGTPYRVAPNANEAYLTFYLTINWAQTVLLSDLKSCTLTFI